MFPSIPLWWLFFALLLSHQPAEAPTASTLSMVKVPAGPFWRGASQTRHDEKPERQIDLDAFWIDRTEVTVAAYRRCVRVGACTEPSGGTTNHCNFAEPGRMNYPINCVRWEQASAYCAWAGKRLPTEAEWEKAARGTDKRTYPWGNEDPTCDLAVRGELGCGEWNTWPVGSKPKGRSPYGALDMSGNVWEWVQDHYKADYYAEAPSQNPIGPATGEHRVLRGGGWTDHGISTTTRLNSPSWVAGHDAGVRCALSAP